MVDVAITNINFNETNILQPTKIANIFKSEFGMSKKRRKQYEKNKKAECLKHKGIKNNKKTDIAFNAMSVLLYV